MRVLKIMLEDNRVTESDADKHPRKEHGKEI